MTRRRSSAELVADVGDQRQLLVVDELGELLDEARLLHQPGDFRDHHLPGAAAALLLGPPGPHPERAAAGGIGFRDFRGRIDDHAAGREVRTGDEFDEVAALRIGVIDEMERGVAQLRRVVRRDRGRHADRDALGPVGEQVGERARQYRRLVFRAVIRRTKVDGVLVDALDQEPRHLGEPRLGVAHRRGIIAVDVAEIALAVDQRIALGEVLREAHQGIVNRLVTMRMKLADDVADDARAFLERSAGVEPQQPHGVEETAVNRLQSIARIGERAMHDGRERVVEIALFQRVAERDLLHTGRVGNRFVVHAEGIPNAGEANNRRKRIHPPLPCADSVS